MKQHAPDIMWNVRLVLSKEKNRFSMVMYDNNGGHNLYSELIQIKMIIREIE